MSATKRIVHKTTLLLASFTLLASFLFLQEKRIDLQDAIQVEKSYQFGEEIKLAISINRSWSSLTDDLFIESIPSNFVLIGPQTTKTDAYRLSGLIQTFHCTILPIKSGHLQADKIELRLGKNLTAKTIAVPLPNIAIGQPEAVPSNVAFSDYKEEENNQSAPIHEKSPYWYGAIIPLVIILLFVVIFFKRMKRQKPTAHKSLLKFIAAEPSFSAENLNQFLFLIRQFLEENFPISVKAATVIEINQMLAEVDFSDEITPFTNILCQSEDRFLPTGLREELWSSWLATTREALKDLKK